MVMFNSGCPNETKFFLIRVPEVLREIDGELGIPPTGISVVYIVK